MGVHHDTASLKAAVVKQPVVVGVDAKANNFHLYKKGIMSGTCGTHLDHAVLVVGYGVDNVTVNGTTTTLEYFKIKNSWTVCVYLTYVLVSHIVYSVALASPMILPLVQAHWGEHGYIRLAAGDKYNGGKGQCGLLMNPTYPTGIH